MCEALQKLLQGLAGLAALQLHALPGRPPPAVVLSFVYWCTQCGPPNAAPALAGRSPPLAARCRYALWLDADLTSGISRNSTTFGNDSLAGAEEFSIGAVELWGLS